MFCVQCGSQNSGGSFCENCGAVVDRQVVVAVNASGAPNSPYQADKKRKTILFSSIGAVLLLVLVILVSGVASPNPLTGAVSSCALANAEGVDLADGGRTLTVDTRGEEEYLGADYSDYECIVNALNTPQRIVERMNSTSALDGQVSDTANGLNYYWKYHPDSGAILTISRD